VLAQPRVRALLPSLLGRSLNRDKSLINRRLIYRAPLPALRNSGLFLPMTIAPHGALDRVPVLDGEHKRQSELLKSLRRRRPGRRLSGDFGGEHARLGVSGGGKKWPPKFVGGPAQLPTALL